jgi:hypothetical protein
MEYRQIVRAQIESQLEEFLAQEAEVELKVSVVSSKTAALQR